MISAFLGYSAVLRLYLLFKMFTAFVNVCGSRPFLLFHSSFTLESCRAALLLMMVPVSRAGPAQAPYRRAEWKSNQARQMQPYNVVEIEKVLAQNYNKAGTILCFSLADHGRGSATKYDT